MTILEGNEVQVCASFVDTPLDRNVEVHFIVQPDSATGMVVTIVKPVH